MKTYNKDRTQELDNSQIDLENGYLVQKIEIIEHEAVPAIKEEGHYEVKQEYKKGRDIVWIIDVQGQEGNPAYTEEIYYQLYIPYSAEYLHNRNINRQIKDLKEALAATDYKILKYLEGCLDEQEFNDIKIERQAKRTLINELESQLYQTVPEDNGETY